MSGEAKCGYRVEDCVCSLKVGHVGKHVCRIDDEPHYLDIPAEPSPVAPGEAQRGCPKCGGAIGSNHLTDKPECYRCGPIPPSVTPGEPERPEPQGQIPTHWNVQMARRVLDQLLEWEIANLPAGDALRVGENAVQCAIRLMAALTSCREERDRAQAAIREAITTLKKKLPGLYVESRQLAIVRLEDALKPVSDRQPEGEKP